MLAAVLTLALALIDAPPAAPREPPAPEAPSAPTPAAVPGEAADTATPSALAAGPGDAAPSAKPEEQTFGAVLAPAAKFGRDDSSCGPPPGSRLNCGTGEAWARLGPGASNFGGVGLGWEAGLDVFVLLGPGPWAAKGDLETWGHLNGVGVSSSSSPAQGEVGGVYELGLGVALPSYANTGLTPFAMANLASFLGGSFDGSDFIGYTPNLELGIVGRRFGLSAAGGYAFFAADNKLETLAFQSSDGPVAFDSDGLAPLVRVDGYVDLPLGSSMTLRAAARVEDLHQALNEVPGFDFGSRDIAFGRAELLLRIGSATLGPSVTFFSPQKAPVLSSLPSFQATLPETSFQFLFGI